MASRASRSAPVDGFRLTYDRFGTPGAAPVVLLHGWPGSRHDFRRMVPLLAGHLDVVVPDLRGFGGSDKHEVSVSHFYCASAQAASIVGLIRELELGPVVLAGYDVGSRVAQSVARMHTDLVRALVLSPPLPGAGDRVLTPQAQSEFWYQAFHQLPLATQLVDGNPDTVREYLRHFWDHWSGPFFEVTEDDLDVLVSDYALPGAFSASIAWYRAGAGTVAQALSELPAERAIRIHAPTDVLWPRHDPLFPSRWADRLGDHFTDIRLHFADDAGHFTPLECPELFTELVLGAARSSPSDD
ncbi:alpha/beta fold hydrolase [Mycobacterium sp. NAZ190054]|uniref:alpha/beta fold hydrolase n=1 Tax=Mycobacterium sp. NAZ190054 TaxID=1747766 RepID=UPI0007929A56|nr:alpha/beta hydrolase [Mycobacterium sp. NAZ190054]KWX59607.1 epoxide hydrolase [Mycobacterium sp. NAZ190054]